MKLIDICSPTGGVVFVFYLFHKRSPTRPVIVNLRYGISSQLEPIEDFVVKKIDV